MIWLLVCKRVEGDLGYSVRTLW